MPRVVTAGVVLLAAGLAVMLLMLFALHGAVTSTSLAVSVGRDVPGRALEGCDAKGGGRWSCDYMVNGSSAQVAGYAVQVDPGSSCWRGRLTALPRGVAGWPKRIDGCVRRWQPW